MLIADHDIDTDGDNDSDQCSDDNDIDMDGDNDTDQCADDNDIDDIDTDADHDIDTDADHDMKKKPAGADRAHQRAQIGRTNGRRSGADRAQIGRRV